MHNHPSPISFIFAYVMVGDRKIIGDEAGLLWHSTKDMKVFKSLTLADDVVGDSADGVASDTADGVAPRKPAVLMGRKTWETLPKRPLPNRHNIIISRQENFLTGQAGVYHFTNIDDAIKYSQAQGWVLSIIGGAEIFHASYDHADVIFATELKGEDFFTREPKNPCYFDMPFENNFKMVEQQQLQDKKISITLTEWHRKGTTYPVRLSHMEVI